MSDAFKNITDYIRDKVSKTNVNNPKANSGAVLLALFPEFEEQVDHLVYTAFHTIQLHFTTDNSSNPAGTAKLTVTSSSIGLKVHKMIHREPVPWSMQIRLGDLFIEAFHQLGYIDLYYARTRDSSYIISATPKWIELAEIPEVLTRINLTGTKFHPPEGGLSLIHI